MKRRYFLKSMCSVCVLTGTGLMTATLSSCSHLPVYKTVVTGNRITVPVSLFAQGDLHMIRVTLLDYDIALRKETDGTYTALLLRCTHADNQVSSNGDGFICNLHGSRYNKQGSVIKGPAEHPLKKYTVEINSDNLIIIL